MKYKLLCLIIFIISMNLNSIDFSKFDTLYGLWTHKYYIDTIDKNDELLIFNDEDYHQINSEMRGREFWMFLNPFYLNITKLNIIIEMNMVGFNYVINNVKDKNNTFIIDATETNMRQDLKSIIEISSKNNFLSFNTKDSLNLEFINLIKIENMDTINKISKMRDDVISKFGNYICTVDNLRLRESDNINSNIIENIKINDKLYVWGIGKYDIINNIKGQWLYVVTENKKLGYCFNAYLEKVK